MDTHDIKECWWRLNERLNTPALLAEEEIDRIMDQYNGASRYYHNIYHLADLIYLHREYAPLIVDNDTVLFAIYYHDVVYKATRHDNEEKSAHEARIFLQKIGYQHQKKVIDFIHATKGHKNPLSDPDLDYFLDFDLHVLGEMPAIYNAYTKNVRKEYSFYPSYFYRKGRRRVLQHFLGQTSIYHTAPFREKYEKKARENMERELENL